MISSKLNFLVSAAILASTVYILWIKIKRKSSSQHRIESDSEICKKSQTEEVAELQSESLDDYADSKFNTQEENEKTKCSFNIGELEAQNLNDQEKIYPLTNIVNVSVEEIMNNNLEISTITTEISNTGHDLMEVKKYNYNEFSTEVENENQINMSLEDGEIIDESLVENIINGNINNNFSEYNLTSEKVSEQTSNFERQIPGKSLELENENKINMSLEDGEIIDESFENNLSEYNLTNEKDSKQTSEISNCKRQVLRKSPEFYDDIEEGEIVEDEIENSESEDEENYEKMYKELMSPKNSVENPDIINTVDKEIEVLMGNNISNESVNRFENIDSMDNNHDEVVELLSQIMRESPEYFKAGKYFDYLMKNSKSEENYEKMFKELLEENKNFIEFKDLLDYRNEINNDQKTFEELLEEVFVNVPQYTSDDVHCISQMSEEYLNNGEKNEEIIDKKEEIIEESMPIENIDSMDNTGEKNEELIDNKEEIIEESMPIENIDSMDNTGEKNEELIDKKEEIIEESMPIENYNQIKKESERVCSTETDLEKENLMTSIMNNDANEEEISNNNNLIDEIKNEYLGNELNAYSKIENTETSTNNINISTSDLSENSDYLDDAPLDKFMDYIDECLNGNETKIDENCKLENWPNDEDSLNNIKRDFYENSTAICSPHPSSESDHAHCVNNLTERVAILSAESILDNQCQLMNSSDSEMTPTLSSPTLDDSNPELYVEKITYDGKELDVVYFEESLLEEGGIQSDIKIIRTIPVGLGGRIIGKKGKTKNELLKKYGAQLLIYNHPNEIGKQILEITCNPSVSNQLENWVNKTLEQISKNTIQTTVSNPEWLKPMIPLGRLVAAHIVDMSTVQYVKIRIFDRQLIKEFNQMQNEMNIDYSRADNTSLLPRPVAAGCVCVAMIRPDYFLRAQIVDIYEDFAWVYLFDLGKVCQTYLCYLFKIREKYMRVPFQVIPARMPHALIKNKNISPAIIYKRFLCDPVTNKPKMVRVFFPRMNTCCEPCVNIYIPMPTVSADSSSNNGEFVDLLELLVSIDVCSMVRETVNSDLQVKINTNHFRAFLNGKDKKQNSNVPVYFQPCNSKFYDDFIEFKSENEVTN